MASSKNLASRKSEYINIFPDYQNLILTVWCIFSKDDSEDEVNQSTTSSHAYQKDENGPGSSRRHEGGTANISVLTEPGFAEASSFHDRSTVMSRTLLSFLFDTYVKRYI